MQETKRAHPDAVSGATIDEITTLDLTGWALFRHSIAWCQSSKSVWCRKNKRHHRPSEGNTIRTIITNFIHFNAQTVSNEVLMALGFVYTVLLILTIISIMSGNSAPSVKVAWCALAVLLPAVGIAVYCVRCIAGVDKTSLERFKPERRSKYAPNQLST
jgi:hypothetical protein